MTWRMSRLYRVRRSGRYFSEWQQGSRMIPGRDPRREWIIAKVKAFIGIECQTDEEAEAALGLAEMCDMVAGGDETRVGYAYREMLDECGAGVEWVLGADALRRAKRTMH
jgi:hypothetical protein